MRAIAKISAVALATVLSVGAANAATSVDILDAGAVSTASITNPAYEVISMNVAYRTTTSGSYKSPWDAVVGAGSGLQYIAVQAGGSAAVNYDFYQDSITFLWGSPDGYNNLSFYNGTDLVGSLTGLDVTNVLGGHTGSGYHYVTLVPEGYFNRIVFSSTNNAFEFAQVSATVVPLPAAGILLVGALGGLGVFARRRK